RVLLPDGVGRDAVGAIFGKPPAAGLHAREGRLEVDVVPVVPQPRYDELLWLCDLNFVRGEDSFVRAQWAGKPLVWQAYRQDDGADRIKLDAFLARYLAAAAKEAGAGPVDAAGLPAAAAAALRALMHAWNGHGHGHGDVGPAWRGLLDALAPAAGAAARWCKALAAQADLAARLVEAARKLL
ncbi:MAG: elongation factor P maturation arginine rhamnosyltransferase EarP, partial [Gammaproteobacteria bacterium]